TVNVTVVAVNDVPVIGGASSGSVTEDVNVVGGNLTTCGSLSISDVDQGQSSFAAQLATSATYGSFALTSVGGWTYTVNDSRAAIQQLAAGQSISDSFTALSSDGTASQLVSVVIHGSNDVPVSGAAWSGSLTEDVNVVGGNLTTGGSLSISDVDQGQSSFAAQLATSATYGSFALTSAGGGTYPVNDSLAAIQQLAAGQSISDSFTALSSDGT